MKNKFKVKNQLYRPHNPTCYHLAPPRDTIPRCHLTVLYVTSLIFDRSTSKLHPHDTKLDLDGADTLLHFTLPSFSVPFILVPIFCDYVLWFTLREKPHTQLIACWTIFEYAPFSPSFSGISLYPFWSVCINRLHPSSLLLFLSSPYSYWLCVNEVQPFPPLARDATITTL